MLIVIITDNSKHHIGTNTVICTYAVPVLTWRWPCWGSLHVCGGWRPGRWQWPAWLWTRSRTLAGSGWRCIPGSPWQNAASRVCTAAADGTAPSGRLLLPALRGKETLSVLHGLKHLIVTDFEMWRSAAFLHGISVKSISLGAFVSVSQLFELTLGTWLTEIHFYFSFRQRNRFK